MTSKFRHKLFLYDTIILNFWIFSDCWAHQHQFPGLFSNFSDQIWQFRRKSTRFHILHSTLPPPLLHVVLFQNYRFVSMPPKKTEKESKSPKSSDKKSSKSSSKSSKTKDSKKKSSTKKSSSKDKKKSKTSTKTEKAPAKKFDLPGQKKETPEELDAIRMFYESAYQENPNSEMAARWCLLHGLLPSAVATTLHTKGFDALRKKNISATKAVKKEKSTSDSQASVETPSSKRQKTDRKPPRQIPGMIDSDDE